MRGRDLDGDQDSLGDREARAARDAVERCDTEVEPTPAGTASPLEPASLLTEATAPSFAPQLTCSVRLCTDSSEKMPVAVNCRVVPRGASGLAGVTWMETSDACHGEGPALRDACRERRDDRGPQGSDFARPWATSATASSDERHSTDEVRSFLLLSE